MQKFVFFLTWCVLILCNYKVLSLTLKPKIKKAQQKLQLYLYICFRLSPCFAPLSPQHASRLVCSHLQRNIHTISPDKLR